MMGDDKRMTSNDQFKVINKTPTTTIMQPQMTPYLQDFYIVPIPQKPPTLFENPNYSTLAKVALNGVKNAFVIGSISGLIAYPYWARMGLPTEVCLSGTLSHMARYSLVGAIYGSSTMAVAFLRNKEDPLNHALGGVLGGIYSGIHSINYAWFKESEHFMFGSERMKNWLMPSKRIL